MRRVITRICFDVFLKNYCYVLFALLYEYIFYVLKRLGIFFFTVMYRMVVKKRYKNVNIFVYTTIRFILAHNALSRVIIEMGHTL